MAMILVTHDLGVVATRTDEIIVMYAGNVVERAPTNVLFKSMAMPYTEALLKSTPRIAEPSHTRLTAIEGRPPDLLNPPPGCPFSPRCPYAQDKCHVEKPPLVEAAPGHSYACWYPLTTKEPAGVPDADPTRCRMTDTTVEASAVTTDPLLSVEDLHVSFGKGNATVQAVAGITFTMHQGETLGLVGESGCGKSTTGRAIVQVEKATSGRITFGDTELTALSRGDLRTLRTQVQMIFQDPDLVAQPAAPDHRHRRRTPDHLEDRVQGGAARDVASHARPGRHRPLRQRLDGAPASSPAASASASASPAPSSSSRSSWSATRSSPPSTCRSRRRSSTCCRT